MMVRANLVDVSAAGWTLVDAMVRANPFDAEKTSGLRTVFDKACGFRESATDDELREILLQFGIDPEERHTQLLIDEVRPPPWRHVPRHALASPPTRPSACASPPTPERHHTMVTPPHPPGAQKSQTLRPEPQPRDARGAVRRVPEHRAPPRRRGRAEERGQRAALGAGRRARGAWSRSIESTSRDD